MEPTPLTTPPPPVPLRQPRLPSWLQVPYRGAPARASVRRALRQAGLHTVCEGARCPNLCECWAAGTATFLILGSTCTRDCRFCAVPHGPPATVAADEPERLAAAARALGLRFVVLTSVTRDDLRDGGAAHFAACIRAIRGACPQAGIEVLVPDFRGSADAQAAVLEAGADVFNHNLETCRRLSPEVRPQADYARSLEVLARAARHTPAPLVKSGFMLGMGETAEEVREMLADLRRAGVRALTIGQYLPPSPRHWPLARYVPPADFAACERRAREEFGFPFVASGPRVRSSYRAEEAFRQGRVGGAKRERTAEETVG